MRRSLGWLALVLVALCIFVAREFVGTVVLAAFVVTTFQPMWRRLAMKTSETLASLALTVSIIVVIVAPLVVFGVVLTSRLVDLINELMAMWQRGDLASALNTVFHQEVSLPRFGDLYREIARAAPSVLASVGKVFFALSNATIKAFLFVVLLYGLFAHGRAVSGWLERSSPLGERPTKKLMRVFAETGRGILAGVFLVMVLHGVVATVGYLIVGIGRAVELGTLTALAGLVPAIGTGLVWIPLALVLFVTGHVGQGIGVVIVGLIVGIADNVLRPWLSRLGKVPLPTLLLFVAFFGGLTAFGGAGVLLGPLLFALAKTAVDSYVEEEREAS
jgi:predicted PurR-regulated permease PerM